RAMFLDDLREVLARGVGVEGLVRELQLYFHWGFSLAELPAGAEVVFWHGTGDGLVPPAMSRYMAERGPGSTVHYRPGGHFLVLDHLEEVLADALGRLRE